MWVPQKAGKNIEQNPKLAEILNQTCQKTILSYSCFDPE